MQSAVFYPWVSSRIRQPVLRHGRKPAQLNRAQIRILRAAEQFAQSGERVTQAQIAEAAGKLYGRPRPGWKRSDVYAKHVQVGSAWVKMAGEWYRPAKSKPISQGYVAKVLQKLEYLGFIKVTAKRGRYGGGTWLSLGIFNRLRYAAWLMAKRIKRRIQKQLHLWGDSELPAKQATKPKRKQKSSSALELYKQGRLDELGEYLARIR